MSFVLTAKAIKEGKVVILYDEAALSGVKKIAAKVASDIGAVFGATPAVSEWENITVGTLKKIEYPILVGTLGCGCNILTELGIADLPEISGKREVYLHKIIENLPKNSTFFKAKSAFLIAGSDKRGTVYGLFALSEMLGVSPFIDWLDIKPERKTTFTIPSAYTCLSKEPSVRFRGFFINDEWPAFGNWCNKRFGGFNAK